MFPKQVLHQLKNGTQIRAEMSTDWTHFGKFPFYGRRGGRGGDEEPAVMLGLTVKLYLI